MCEGVLYVQVYVCVCEGVLYVQVYVCVCEGVPDGFL